MSCRFIARAVNCILSLASPGRAAPRPGGTPAAHTLPFAGRDTGTATLLSGLPRPNAGTGAFALGVQAYIYGYPLVMMGVTQQVMTNAAMPGTERAPMNQFAYGKLATPAETDVVLPNVNVLYATAWLNLSAGPIVLHIPDVPNRYFLLEILDAWTNVDYDPGTQEATPRETT